MIFGVLRWMKFFQPLVEKWLMTAINRDIEIVGYISNAVYNMIVLIIDRLAVKALS